VRKDSEDDEDVVTSTGTGTSTSELTHTPVRPFVVLGPQVGFRVKCEVTAGSESASCTGFAGENAKSVDFSGTAGAGLGFKVGKEELSLQARYNMGFTKVLSSSDSKNRVFSVLAGFSF